MKHTLLLLFILIATVQFTFAQNITSAQNTIAKLKFEEAEEAYTNNNFELTLTKLKEVETLLKATNPTILYLQILAGIKIIEKNPLGDYAIIENAKTSINKYLKDYENLPDNEDKYREIYKISESSKKYLITRQEFDQQLKQIELEIKQIELEKEAQKKAEINAIYEKSKEVERINSRMNRFIDSLCTKYKFKRGLTEAEFISFNPEASTIIKHSKSHRITDNYVTYMNMVDKMGINNIDFKNGIVSRCDLKIFEEKGSSQSQLYFSNLLKEIKENIPSENLRHYINNERNRQTISITDKNFKIEITYDLDSDGKGHTWSRIEITFNEKE